MFTSCRPVGWLPCLPWLHCAAGAQTGPAPRPPRAEAAPPLSFRSAMEGYKPFADEKPIPWKEANETVRQRGGWRAYAKEAQPATPTHAADAPIRTPGMPCRWRTAEGQAMRRPLQIASIALAAALLAGCASVGIDDALQGDELPASQFTGGKLELSRTRSSARPARRCPKSCSRKPLSQDDAVRLALANSPAVQALIAQSWADIAAANQTGRLPNPVFTFERLRLGDELEIGRLLSFGLVDLILLPQRLSISQSQAAQAQVQLSGHGGRPGHAGAAGLGARGRGAAVAAVRRAGQASPPRPAPNWRGACSRSATSASCSARASRCSMPTPRRSWRRRATRPRPRAKSWFARWAWTTRRRRS